MQAGVAVIERNAPVQSLIDVDFGSGKAEALPLLRDLEALTLPLDNVVVADHALVNEAADAFQILGCRAPCGLHCAGAAGKAAVVVGEKEAQHGVGGVQIASLSQAEFAGETILEHAPESFDAALGLRSAGGDEGDAQLLQGAAELRGLTFAGELFFHRPEVVVANEDAAVVAVKGERSARGGATVGEAGRDSRARSRKERTGRPGFYRWRRLTCFDQWNRGNLILNSPS